MTSVFADTFYWYGLANRRDQWHSRVLRVRYELGDRSLVTTDEVLTEFLAAMSGDVFLRAAGSLLVSAILIDPIITVLPQSHASFIEGLEFYKNRPDKGYSLTDCISMIACRHEGFVVLITR